MNEPWGLCPGSRPGAVIEYRKRLRAPQDEENYLHFAGLVSPITVRVGNLAPGVVVPENSYLRLPPEADAWDLAVSFPHDPSNGPGPVTLLSGALLQGYSVQALPQEKLDALALAAGTRAGKSPSAGGAGAPTGVNEFPLEVAPGGACWVVPDLAELETGSGYFLQAAGTGLMISAWLDGVRLGRLFPGFKDDSDAVTAWGRSRRYLSPGAYDEIAGQAHAAAGKPWNNRGPA